mmetsp:Transcript_16136/g.36996  ORF Transcript_16136/g.36996 Transcript_16136/m.36996 type:complete len:391 (+) Transcript_16136:268-1440(+)
MVNRNVTLSEPSTEKTSLVSGGSNNDEYGTDIDGSEHFEAFKGAGTTSITRRQSLLADRLSERLLAIDDDDDVMEDLILHETLNVDMNTPLITLSERPRDGTLEGTDTNESSVTSVSKTFGGTFCSMTSLCVLVFGVIFGALWMGAEFIGPPNQPVGPYELIERQEGDDFFGNYNFYEGPDSVGSNGYVTYVSEQRAKEIEIARITHEVDELDLFYRKRILGEADDDEGKPTTNTRRSKMEPFLYLSTAATEAGPRESIRLEGKKRFNRGLFIIDVRHMPSGCGTWPAFWLTDEANWPVNGEIDIVEGVNCQSEAKTALHTKKGCDMFDVPVGTMTGSWDTSIGIPDKKTGIPDMTIREAKKLFCIRSPPVVKPRVCSDRYRRRFPGYTP